MERLKSLDPPHKGLRNALSVFALKAGNTNYKDIQEVRELQSIGKEVFHLLHDHTKTEENFILKPLEEKVPGSSLHDTTDHITLDRIEDELEQLLSSFDGTQSDEQGHDFYLKFTEFQGVYLQHIAHEDRVTEVLMQEHFTDEELIAHQIQIMQVMDFETLLLWFKYIVPARRTEENRQVLTAFKANAPAPAFQAVAEVIQKELSEGAFQKLMQGF